MTYEFLKDFHKRIEIVAIIEFITTRIARKQTLRNYGFSGIESINLVILVLCFIMEKSLVEEICTKSDVASYLRRLDIDYFKKNISDEQYPEVADFILRDCLQNGGVPHYFNTYNYKENKEEKINVKLIDDKRVLIRTENVYSFYMTPQGYKFMFNTLEIEEAMQVSIEQFKLSISIKKRNFGVAKNNIDNLFNLSKTQIQKINYFIKKVKEDIGSTGIKEYEEIYNSTFSSIDEQKEGYDNLYELIKNTEKSIIESSDRRLDKDVLEKEAENIIYIKNKLKFIINEQSKLLLKQQELQKIYNEAVDNILYIGFENRINFEEEIVRKIEENPDKMYPLIKILRPLFMPNLEKIFNINIALKEQKVVNAKNYNYESNVLMDESYLNTYESENEIKIRDINNSYVDIFCFICKYTIDNPDNEISLSNLIEESKDDYYKLVPDIKIFMNVLLQLTNIKDIDFNLIKQQRKKTVFNPSEEFDIKYCVLESLNRDEIFDKINKLRVLISRSKNVFIPEKTPDRNDKEHIESDIVMGLNCPDIFFKAEVNKD
ncbi:MAG: hypothetical protein ABF289_02430 [Clostridiales bacterium]